MNESKRILKAWKSQAGWVWQTMWTTPEARGFSHSHSQGPYDTEKIALKHGNAWIEAQITCETDNDKDYARTPEEVAAMPEVQAACDDLVWETNERERFEECYCKLKGIDIEKFRKQREILDQINPILMNMEAIWLAKARQARDDYDFAGQAVKDAARLEGELADAKREAKEELDQITDMLHAEHDINVANKTQLAALQADLDAISKLVSDEDPVQGVKMRDRLRKDQDSTLRLVTKTMKELHDQLATANERWAKAEAVINWLDTHDLIMMGALEGQEIAVLRDAWQLTVPTEKKEVDHGNN